MAQLSEKKQKIFKNPLQNRRKCVKIDMQNIFREVGECWILIFNSRADTV